MMGFGMVAVRAVMDVVAGCCFLHSGDDLSASTQHLRLLGLAIRYAAEIPAPPRKSSRAGAKSRRRLGGVWERDWWEYFSHAREKVF